MLPRDAHRHKSIFPMWCEDLDFFLDRDSHDKKQTIYLSGLTQSDEQEVIEDSVSVATTWRQRVVSAGKRNKMSTSKVSAQGRVCINGHSINWGKIYQISWNNVFYHRKFTVTDPDTIYPHFALIIFQYCR
jgi:hypothetical protein